MTDLDLGDRQRPVGPPPPFDPELEPIASFMADVLSPTVTEADISTLREQSAAATPRPTDTELAGDGAFVVEHHEAPGMDGGPAVPLLVCRSADAATPVPTLYHIHGGGMILGTYRDGLAAVVDLAAEVGAAVVSVEYRLAPETSHPGPVNDCFAGLLWTAEHAPVVGLDPKRIVVTGVSAGAGLAAAIVLMARDRGGPLIAGQLLKCPMLDDRNDTPSAVQMTGLGVWNRSYNALGWRSLLGAAAGGPDVSPYAAPARAKDLSGLPPTYVDVGSAETFRDEDVAYAVRIWQHGGEAELHVWPGGFHGFDSFAPDTAISRDSVAARRAWLRRLLRPHSPTV